MMKSQFRFEIQNNENVEKLFKNCLTLDKYLKNLKEIKVHHIDAFEDHGFQALIEVFVRHFKFLFNYQPTPTENHDLYVHGSGLNKDGHKSAVCAMLEDDINVPITTSDSNLKLNSFFANAREKFSCNAKNSLFVFSNAKSINKTSYKLFVEGISDGFKEKVRFFFRDDIKKKIDKNKKFWSYFKTQLLNTEKSVIPVKELRQFQEDAVRGCFGLEKGKIILPTGTGKTLIQSQLIYNCIKDEGEWIGEHVPIIVVASPRIVLTYQLLEEISHFLISRGVDSHYLNLNSGGLDEKNIQKWMNDKGLTVRDIKSTTSPKDIEIEYRKALKDKVPLVIGSTYQSIGKLRQVKIPIRLLICDEAHNLVDGIGRFATVNKKDVHNLKSKQRFFFTATQAFTASDEGTGMNNEKLFGNVVALGKNTECTYSPKQMLNLGEIVPPYIHEVKLLHEVIKEYINDLEQEQFEELEDNPEIAAITILEAFKEHAIRIWSNATHKGHNQEWYSFAGKIGPKMLVTIKGETTFRSFFEFDFVRTFCEENDINLYGISSASGAYISDKWPKCWIEPQGKSFKEEFMFALRGLKTDENAIIVHIDMIGEGIDVPGITGVMPFRDLGNIKSSQTLGRAMRLVPEDRRALYSGKLDPSNLAEMRKKMIKPRAYVIIPKYSWDHEDINKRIRSIAAQIRNDLGYTPFEELSCNQSDGRMEELRKNAKVIGDVPDELNVAHTIEDHEFEETYQKAKEKFENGEPFLIRKLIEKSKQWM